MTADLPSRPDWPAYPEDEPLHHVVYEFDMLDFTADWLQRHGRSPPPDYSQQMKVNAVLESFLVHVRNLIQFLYADRGKGRSFPTDLDARDYVEDVQKWTASRDSIAYAYETAAHRANKRLAHLTAERDPRGKEWSLDVIPPLREQEILFHANLKPEFKRGTPRHRPTLFRTASLPATAVTTSSAGHVSVNVPSGSLRT